MTTFTSHRPRAWSAAIGCALVICCHAWMTLSWRPLALAALVIAVVAWAAGRLAAAPVAIVAGALAARAVSSSWDAVLDAPYLAIGAGLLYLCVGLAVASVETSTRPDKVSRAGAEPSRSSAPARDGGRSARG